MTRRRSVELVGLPGAGKTSLCQELVSGSSVFEDSRVGTWRGALRRSGLPRLALPLTVVAFRRPVGLLVENRPGVTVSRLFLRSIGVRSVNRDPAADSVYRLLGSLNTVRVEEMLARVEAAIRRKNLLFDEGLVQRGTGFWLLAPDDTRAEVWAGFLACLSSRTGVVLVDCPVKESLRRALGRGAEIPWTFEVAASGDDQPGQIFGVFDATAAMFREAIARRPGTWRAVPGSGDHVEVLANVKDAVLAGSSGRGFLVVARPRDERG